MRKCSSIDVEFHVYARECTCVRIKDSEGERGYGNLSVRERGYVRTDKRYISVNIILTKKNKGVRGAYLLVYARCTFVVLIQV